MNKIYITKILKLLQNEPDLFQNKNITYLSGLISSDISKIKKYLIDNNLIVIDKKQYFITNLGLKFLDANPTIDSYLDKLTNLEYLKLQKTPTYVNKAINILAKHLLTEEHLQVGSVAYNILLELKQPNPHISKLREDIYNFIWKNKRTKLNELFEHYNKNIYALPKSLISIILLDIFVKHKNNLIIYQNNEIKLLFNNILFSNIISCPERYEIQIAIFNEYPILRELSTIIINKPSCNIITITKTLIGFIKSLDCYTLNTNSLNFKTIKFRDAIANAEDPISLICETIPKILCNKKIEDCSQDFIIEFIKCWNELKYNYNSFIDNLHLYILKIFKTESRFRLTERFVNLNEYLLSQDLKVLNNIITDYSASNKLWTERVCICINKSLAPEDWSDLNVAEFKVKLKDLANIFLSIEEIVFSCKAYDKNEIEAQENIVKLISKFNRRTQLEIFKKVLSN